MEMMHNSKLVKIKYVQITDTNDNPYCYNQDSLMYIYQTYYQWDIVNKIVAKSFDDGNQ